MSNEKMVQELNRLVRARCPIIAIQTSETERVVDAIIDMVVYEAARSGDAHEKLFSWTVSRGLFRILTQAEKVDGAQLHPGDSVKVQDPAVEPHVEAFEILQHIVDNDQSGIYILKDLHPFLQAPEVLRSLRDVAEALIKQYKTVILLSPHLDIPGDARKDVKVIDWPLPQTAELAEQVEAFIEHQRVTNRLNGGQARLVRALQGLTTNEADQVLAQSVITYGQLDERAIDFVIQAKADIIKESGALEFYPAQVGQEDVGGLDNLKRWLIAAGLANTQDAQAFGMKPARGVLTVGVPGCGKSLTAKMVSSLWNVPLLRLDIGALFGGLVGQSEQQTRDALKIARAVAPCVLWIDEIEKALGSQGGEQDGGTSARVLGSILTWMEENTGSGVFIFATANDISKLRPELIRRFSEKFFVDLPVTAERATILTIHLQKAKRNPDDFDIQAIAEAMQDFTGAEIEETVQQALWRAFPEHRDINTDDLLVVAAETVPLATTMAEQINAMRSWATRAKNASSAQRESQHQVVREMQRALKM